MEESATGPPKPPPVLLYVVEGFTFEVKNRACDPPAFVWMYLGTGTHVLC